MELQTNRIIEEIGRGYDIAIAERCLERLAEAYDVLLNEDWFKAMGIGPEDGEWFEHPYNQLLKAIAHDLRAAAYHNAMTYLADDLSKTRLWQNRAIELGWKEEEE